MARQNRTLYRRDFLKAASGGVAALAGSPFGGGADARGRTRRELTGKTIRVLVVGDPFQFALDKIKDDFTAQTGINVEMENLAYDQLNARLATSFVSGTPDADVVTVDQMWTGQYSDSGWIIPLDDYISRDADTNIQDFIPEVLYSLNTWRGRMVTLPIAAYGQGVVYRQDVFEANSIEAPPTDAADAAGWTWDRYREIAESLQGTDFEGTNLFGTVVCGAQPVPIVHMYTQLAASRGARWFQSFPTPAVGLHPDHQHAGERRGAGVLQVALRALAARGDQLRLVRRRHPLLPGRHRDVLLVDALLLPDEERRLHDRHPVGRRGQCSATGCCRS